VARHLLVVLQTPTVVPNQLARVCVHCAGSPVLAAGGTRDVVTAVGAVVGGADTAGGTPASHQVAARRNRRVNRRNRSMLPSIHHESDHPRTCRLGGCTCIARSLTA